MKAAITKGRYPRILDLLPQEESQAETRATGPCYFRVY